VYFADIVAISRGALPVRTKTGISFPDSPTPQKFSACSHEIQAGIETGRLKVVKFEAVHFFVKSQNFAAFVDEFMAERVAAKSRGDKAGDILAKLTLNSSYGKFGMNPRTFRDYHIQFDQKRPAADGGPAWELHTDYGDFILWDRPTSARARFNNVAIAASITSAARAVLLRALAVAVRPVYCDTDSIICADLPLEHSASKLGAWKLEAEGDRIAVAGKKLYALMSGAECVKIASKGVRLTAAEVFSVAGGDVVTYKKESPAMGLDGQTRYIERRIKAT
jgi:DNA polymerase elongation subunit (family B)